jgi:hypothetical protein
VQSSVARFRPIRDGQEGVLPGKRNHTSHRAFRRDVPGFEPCPKALRSQFDVESGAKGR